MRSNPRRSPEEAQSSLEESSYEILGESVFDTSDDEGHTESLASTDGHTPDDVSSISDGDEFDDDDYMDDVSQHLPPPHAEATDDPLDDHHVTSPGDSTFTELADKEMSESSHLRLEETLMTDDDDMVACGLIKEFDQTSGLPDVLQPYGCPEVRLTVRMALSEQFMSVSGSFRLLYVGDLPEWAEKDISRQIGTALDAPPSSSRFNIIRGQLEPSGPALDVDHCTALKTEHEAGKSSRVMLTLDDGTRLTFGPGKVTHVKGPAPLPDLVIFYHGTLVPSVSGSVAHSEKCRLARDAFRRHQIPSLDVALARPFGQCPEAFTFDSHSLRLCVEGRKYQDSEYEIQETLPIDIYDFIKIEPSQLNRHLACIKSHASLPASKHVDGKERGWIFRNMVTSLKKSVTRLDIREWLAQKKLLMSFVALTAMVLFSLSASKLAHSVPQNIPQVEIHSPIYPFLCASTSSSASVVTPTTATSLSVAAPSTAPVRSTTRDLTMVASADRSSDDRGEARQEEKRQQYKVRQEKSGGFEVQVTGDHQFLLRHPKYVGNGRRKPHISVQVSQDSKEVPVRFDSTSGIVDLEHEYSLGLFNVTIVARSKPLLQQSFELKLGSNKSTISQLKDNVDRLSESIKHDLSRAQSNLRNLTTAVTEGIQAGVVRFEEGAVAAFGQTRYWKQQVQDSTQSVAMHLEEAKKKAAHQLSIGSNITKDISKVLRRNIEDCTARASGLAHALQETRFPNLWEITRPVRTSRTILQARHNALRLQKKVQRKLEEKKGGKDTSKAKKQCNGVNGCRKSKHSKVRTY